MYNVCWRNARESNSEIPGGYNRKWYEVGVSEEDAGDTC